MAFGDGRATVDDIALALLLERRVHAAARGLRAWADAIASGAGRRGAVDSIAATTTNATATPPSNANAAQLQWVMMTVKELESLPAPHHLGQSAVTRLNAIVDGRIGAILVALFDFNGVSGRCSFGE